MAVVDSTRFGSITGATCHRKLENNELKDASICTTLAWNIKDM